MKSAKVLAAVVGSFAMLGLSLSPMPAMADALLDFNVAAPTTGTISYAGGANPLVGSGISVNTVVGLDTPLNNLFVVGCIGCTLDFTTGASTGTWTWGGGAGSSITITGTLDFNNNHVVDGSEAAGTIMTGSFGTATVVGFGDFKMAGSAFSDTKDEALTAFYGLSGGPYAGNFNLSFNATGNQGDKFESSRVLSGDVTNTPVPEPASLMLLGAGLAGIGIWRRKSTKI